VRKKSQKVLDREMLKQDLARHIQRLEELKARQNISLLERETPGSIPALILHYKKIIKEIKLELKTS